MSGPATTTASDPRPKAAEPQAAAPVELPPLYTALREHHPELAGIAETALLLIAAIEHPNRWVCRSIPAAAAGKALKVVGLFEEFNVYTSPHRTTGGLVALSVRYMGRVMEKPDAT
jgi:hypothetical protein